MTNSPHDALFRFTFGQPEHAAVLLRTLLPRGVARAIDWSTLKLCPGTQIDRRLRRVQSDLLFTARVGRRPVLLYLLCEHKSRNDPWAALQLLGYVVGIWRALRRQRPRPRRLPLVLSILVHHGRRGWTASTDLAGLLDTEGLPSNQARTLLAMQPRFRYLVKSYAHCTADELRGLALTLLGKVTLAALQFLPGAPPERVLAAVVRWADMVAAVFTAPSGQDALAALSTYVLSTTAVDADALIEVVSRAVEYEAGMNMKSTAARLRAEGKLEGKLEGKAEGKAEGELSGRAELLCQMLVARFGELPIALRDQVACARREELDGWAIRCLHAPTLDQVFADG